MKAKIIILVAVVAALTAWADDGLMAYSMLTRDGRRMVSRLEGGRRVYSRVPTNQLPANLPPVREWKLYGIKAAHTDIGLTNPQYIQRHWTVRRIDEAARLIDADKRADSDPAAYRYVMEGVWFWDNYHQDKGMDAAWRIVTNYMARGRMDVGVTCAGNHTHLYSETEIDRSTLTKRLLEQKWGIHTHTFFMADNPGLSCSLIDPYARAPRRQVQRRPFARDGRAPRHVRRHDRPRGRGSCVVASHPQRRTLLRHKRLQGTARVRDMDAAPRLDRTRRRNGFE